MKQIRVSTKDGHWALIKENERSFLRLFKHYWLYIFSKKHPKDIIHGTKHKSVEKAKNAASAWNLADHVKDLTS